MKNEIHNVEKKLTESAGNDTMTPGEIATEMGHQLIDWLKAREIDPEELNRWSESYSDSCMVGMTQLTLSGNIGDGQVRNLICGMVTAAFQIGFEVATERYGKNRP